MSEKVLCSQAALAVWRSELEQLETRGRAEVAEAFALARDDGTELAENVAYQLAIQENDRLMVRIDTLRDLIERAEVPRRTTRTASVGTVVEVELLAPRKRKPVLMQVLLDAAETGDDPEIELVSPASPLGRALLGARPGESVSWEAPAGTFKATVVSIALAAIARPPK